MCTIYITRYFMSKKSLRQDGRADEGNYILMVYVCHFGLSTSKYMWMIYWDNFNTQNEHVFVERRKSRVISTYFFPLNGFV